MLDSILCCYDFFLVLFIYLYKCCYDKKTPAWCEHKWPKTAAIFPLESNPRSLLLTSVSVRFSVHTTQESVTKTHPICDGSLSRKNSAASLRDKNRSEIGVLCAKESPIRYVFGAGTTAFRYSVDSVAKMFRV